MYATQWTGARASGANCLFQGHDPGPGRGPWPEELWLQVDATLTHSRVWAVPLLLSAGTHCLAMPSEPWPGLQGCLGQLWPHLLPLEPHHHLNQVQGLPEVLLRHCTLSECSSLSPPLSLPPAPAGLRWVRDGGSGQADLSTNADSGTK